MQKSLSEHSEHFLFQSNFFIWRPTWKATPIKKAMEINFSWKYESWWPLYFEWNKISDVRIVLRWRWQWAYLGHFVFLLIGSVLFPNWKIWPFPEDFTNLSFVVCPVFKKVFRNCRKVVFGWAFFLLAVPYLPVHGRLCIVYAGEFMLSSNAAYFVALSWPTPFEKIVFAQIYLNFMLRPPSVHTINFKNYPSTINF